MESLDGILGLDSMLTIILLVFMLTTWYLRQEASKREFTLNMEVERLRHERTLARDKQFTDMTNNMIDLLRACQESVSSVLEGEDT